MEGVNEIDCNEELWDDVTFNLQNGWGNLENEMRFAYEVTDDSITEDDIEMALWEVFENIDQIDVTEVELDEGEEGVRYFGASIIIYYSGI